MVRLSLCVKVCLLVLELIPICRASVQYCALYLARTRTARLEVTEVH